MRPLQRALMDGRRARPASAGVRPSSPPPPRPNSAAFGSSSARPNVGLLTVVPPTELFGVPDTHCDRAATHPYYRRRAPRDAAPSRPVTSGPITSGAWSAAGGVPAPLQRERRPLGADTCVPRSRDAIAPASRCDRARSTTHPR